MGTTSAQTEIRSSCSDTMRSSKLTGELIAGFGVHPEFAAPVNLLLGYHPIEERELTELEEAAGDHVVWLAPNADIQGADAYGSALRMWRESFRGWHPDSTALGRATLLARQRWEHVHHHIHPVSCAYFFARGAPRTPAYHQQVQDEWREVFERVAKSVQDCPTAGAMTTWVVPLWPTKELRDVFEKIAGLDEPTRHRLGINESETGFLLRYAATLEGEIDERLHPRQFEHLVAEIYEAEGWRCDVSPYSRDDGVDVVASRDEDGEETLLLIQAKRYRSSSGGRTERPVGLDDVKVFAATVRSKGRDRGVLVTTSRFTRGASSWAHGDGQLVADVDLVDGKELGRRLQRLADNICLPGSVSHIFDRLTRT
jgi:hypothetical protein